jgi:hypothetical protein
VIVAKLRDDLAAHIRHVDGDNTMDPYDRGDRIASFLYNVRELISTESEAIRVESFVIRASRNKTMSADALADAIVDRFKLDEEN